MRSGLGLELAYVAGGVLPTRAVSASASAATVSTFTSTRSRLPRVVLPMRGTAAASACTPLEAAAEIGGATTATGPRRRVTSSSSSSIGERPDGAEMPSGPPHPSSKVGTNLPTPARATHDPLEAHASGTKSIAATVAFTERGIRLVGLPGPAILLVDVPVAMAPLRQSSRCALEDGDRGSAATRCSLALENKTLSRKCPGSAPGSHRLSCPCSSAICASRTSSSA